MAACQGNAAANIADMIAIVAEFQNLGWTWDPNVGGRSPENGRQLLDRQIAAIGRGECGWLAHALNELLAAPAPYGFGVVGAVTQTYDGNGEGFVSPHAGVVHNLPANISQQNGVTLSQSYKWGDHVVVSYLGRYWDPSYNTSYANLQGMASHLIVNMHSTLIGNGPDIDVSLECHPTGGGANVWLRSKKQWENILPHLPVGGWIGPTVNRTVTPPRPVTQQNNNCVIL
jgi:hypothetical protein